MPNNTNEFDDLGDLDKEPDAKDTKDSKDSVGTEDTSDGEDIDPRTVPAFEYDKDMREYFYARHETWGRFEDLITQLRLALGQEHGLRDVPKRELHDAAMREFVGCADTESMAQRVVDARTEDGEE